MSDIKDVLRINDQTFTLDRDGDIEVDDPDKMAGCYFILKDDAERLRDWLNRVMPKKDAELTHSAERQPSRAPWLALEQQCRMFCAWKGGGPCLAEDCPRRTSASSAEARQVFNHERDCGLTNDAGTCECLPHMDSCHLKYGGSKCTCGLSETVGEQR